jgi:hypothetical protein
MANYFSISGYWKSDLEPFDGHIVKSTNDIDEDNDDNIFFYGLSENDIKTAILFKEETEHEFVITEYTKIS